MKDISFDLETLGTSANSKILSIGAAYFDRYSGAIGRTLYLIIDTNDDPQGEVSEATLKWWSEQEAAARAVFSYAVKCKARDAVIALQEFVDPDACVWGNGSGFDITILGSYIVRHGHREPWKFWNVRDMRTVVDLAGHREPWKFWNVRDMRTVVDLAGNPALSFVGTKHNAVDDAVHQAKVIAECIGRLTR